ncbi:autotransporter outer membrane beta-barrel domain-containing protein [Phascolarctobacterium sp.]
MMKNKKALSRKIARTLLAMSIVYSGELYVINNVESASKPDFPQQRIEIERSQDSGVYDYSNVNIIGNNNNDCGLLIDYGSESRLLNNTINFNGVINIDVTANQDANAMETFMSNGRSNDNYTTINLNDNVFLKAAKENYALLLSINGCMPNATLNVNPNENKTVQILGNVGIIAGTASGNRLINLTLNNKASYLAGDLELDGSYGSDFINFKLNSGACWYPNEINDYSIDEIRDNYNVDQIAMDLDGGIIDLYHSQPGVARTDADAMRTFTLSGITDDVSGAAGTTFRIGSNISEGWSDQIVLNGAGTGRTDNYQHKYFIEIVADPSITPDSNTSGLNIQVAQVGNTMTTANTQFIGNKYVGAEVAGGLMYADLTPSIGNKIDNTNEWFINSITAENFRGKASAAEMAEVGAATALNVTSAWRADTSDLQRRLGDLRNNSDEAGVWVRMYGGKNEVVKGQQTDMSYKAVQGGYDHQSSLKNGKLFTGFTVSHLDGDISSGGIDGDINSTMFGLYGSYVGDKGHFADLIIKYGRVNSDFDTIRGTNRYGSDYGSNGFSITTEYGYRQNLKNNFYIEPQAELTYSRIGSSDYTMSMNDGEGAKVYNDAFKSLIGRIGFNIGHQRENNNIYAKLSLAREFQGDVATRASYGDVTRSYETGGSDTWVEYGIGFNSKLSKGTNLYGEIEKTTGSIIKTKWRANVGLRYSF